MIHDYSKVKRKNFKLSANCKLIEITFNWTQKVKTDRNYFKLIEKTKIWSNLLADTQLLESKTWKL